MLIFLQFLLQYHDIQLKKPLDQFKPAATIDRHKKGKMLKTHTNGKVKVFLEFANVVSFPSITTQNVLLIRKKFDT